MEHTFEAANTDLIHQATGVPPAPTPTLDTFELIMRGWLFSILGGYGITGCGVFKAGIQNWKGFCIKINCSQMKLLNFENWTNGEPQ